MVLGRGRENQKWNQEESFRREKVTQTAENVSQGPAIAIAYGTRKHDQAHIGKEEEQASQLPARGLRIANRNRFDKGEGAHTGICDCKVGI